MRHNVSQILFRSTLMPFRWLKTCFRCFYCYDMFDLLQDLKSHQATHTNEDISKVINNYYEDTVLVDVSNLHCTLCSDAIENLHQLVHHLMADHALHLDINVGHCMVPFNLDDQECVVCQASLKTYGNLVAHMLKKHKMITQLRCKTCNVQFRDSKDVCACMQRESGCCSECSENVERDQLTDHMRAKHGKRYRCLACWEYFRTHYQRSLHMASVHQRREFVKCLYCPRSFIFGSILKRHIRERHLKERNAVCHVCGWKTFGHHELKVHMVKHASVKEHKCSMCEKMFKTKKSMRQHCAKNHY